MNKLPLGLLITSILAGSGIAAEGPQVSPVAWLLMQIRTGESTNKYDLVQQSLYRLEKIDPDNPQVLAAQIRMALRQGDQAKAQTLLDELKKVAPNDVATRESETGLRLMSAEGRQQLQQARLLATAGRVEEAKAAWDALFHGVFPDVNTELEYWRLVARLPNQQLIAYRQLQALEARYPGNIGVELQLARMAFDNNQPGEALVQLRRLANRDGGRDAASELWLQQIQNQPVSDRSVASLKQYLQVFTSGDAQQRGEEELARQQKLLADPAYRERMRGLALVDAGGGAGAIATLSAALKANPNDAELMGAMGQAQARANNRAAAISWLQKAIQAGQASTQVGKWQSLLQTNRYWLAINNGDDALKKGDVAGAERQYRSAQAIDNRDSWALIGLGDVAQARKNDAQAEQYWQQALRLDRSNTTAVRRLAALYQQQSPARAMAFINALPAAQQRALAETLRSLRSDSLRAEADALAQQGQWHQAVVKYRQAAQDNPNDVWLSYRLANALRSSGEEAQGAQVMDAMVRHHAQEPAAIYAWALWLSSGDQDDAALAALHRLPETRWDSNMHELADRLTQDKVYARATELRANGNESAALALLQQQPASTRRDITLADWALERGDAKSALASYQRVLQQDATNNDAALGRIEALIALKRKDEARKALQALPTSVAQQNINSGRRVALAWQNSGDTARAQQLFSDLKTRAAKEAPSQSKALVYRDAARLETQQQQPDAAQQDYRLAMAASGISADAPQDNDSYTQLTRNDASDDWLKRGIRSDAADLYRQQDTTFTLEQDYSRDKGTGGISDFTAHTTMMQAETPLADGRSFVRVDHVLVSAGTFATRDGSHSERFGSCNDDNSGGCSRDFTQRDEGTSIGVGWHNDRWSGDIGTTPLGFEVTNWVGGLSWKTDVDDIGVTFTASRRPISSSLLAYAGARDPAANGGKTWGGVVATGGSVGLSYDQGGANGVWADISAHQITGENVADNSRERLMAGYYYKLINEDNRRATVGLNSMLWHYQKDLSDYTFGQGGYYSPQQYFSLAVPVTYRQRTENWSFDLGGSVSWSQSQTDGQQRYPVNPGFTLASNPTSDSSSGNGFGYTLQAVVERRVTPHWSVGLAMDIQQAKDYTPSHGLIYMRYSMGGWNGDMDMPPQPLDPYADFK
ncbi:MULTISPECIES: cellulose synthase complex outer membrane protein BcsC [unclassified Pantoea]|uniref:cellulose synthase complex outer membrane protein BcsC n=1 Tax=unclassified Pantoea TaxID=2630326 RepID=UPI001CD44621|nr:MULTISPECIES: cellulose synthase complex outer membrane protein BcsC [unclassified Pantoea]MCA1178530.1 cellulose biosynthesis protein BcsC [Pantoea sp. alder69]MCA1253153.1 cellulose biosynthesis protein BcsC [Pantoea sp. alder70]MCA1266932.1 cellulose biosynthesis protein BcsC [Pantoea sp. alder81]